MLVYKGVLHLSYGGGNGEIFNSLPFVSEKKYGMIAHDIRCADAGKMHYNEIRARMSALKDEE